MRVYPPIPLHIGRWASRETTICGKTIPQVTLAIIMIVIKIIPHVITLDYTGLCHTVISVVRNPWFNGKGRDMSTKDTAAINPQGNGILAVFLPHHCQYNKGCPAFPNRMNTQKSLHMNIRTFVAKSAI